MKQDPTFSKWFVPVHLTEKEKKEMDKKIAGEHTNKNSDKKEDEVKKEVEKPAPLQDDDLKKDQ